jgi:predicted nucleic acid-binding protein
VTRPLVLDAAIVVALLDSRDAHHDVAVQLLEAHADAPFLMNSLNLAEALVRPALAGNLPEVLAELLSTGLTQVEVPANAATRLASMRATTGSKMPDSCVLLTAQLHSAAVATFDERLRRSAEALGIDVVSVPTA